MKKLFEILSVIFEAFAESNHTAHSDQVAADHEAADRQIKRRAASGDTTVSVSNPHEWEAFKPRGA